MYPWDPKYRIVSTVGGKIRGWFEGKFERYDVNGHADLKSFTPSTTNAVVPLPLDGSLDYQLRPREARVSNGALQFYSTAIRADGLILPRMSDLKVNVNSADLKDLSFIYADANGSGSFDGTITGDIAKPLLTGEFRLQNHKYKEWTIQLAAGGVRLDTQMETASFKDVRVTQGNSFVVVNGSAALSGSPLDLRVQSNRVTGNDLQPFVQQRNISGIFAGEAHITALSPTVQLEGDLRAENLSIDNETVGNARAHVRYFDPVVELTQATIEQTGSTVTGSVSFDRTTEALRFNARVNSVDLQRFYRFGLPRSRRRTHPSSRSSRPGTTRQPNIIGNATLQNLKLSDEIVPAGATGSFIERKHDERRAESGPESRSHRTDQYGGVRLSFQCAGELHAISARANCKTTERNHYSDRDRQSIRRPERSKPYKRHRTHRDCNAYKFRKWIFTRKIRSPLNSIRAIFA